MKWIPIGGMVIVTAVVAFLLGQETADKSSPPEILLRPDALLATLADPDWGSRTHRFSKLIEQLNPDNLAGILEITESSSVQLTRDELRILMHNWIRFDPKGAFDYARFSPQNDRRWMSGAVIDAWTRRDSEGARNALLGIQNTDLGRHLEERMLVAWIESEGPSRAFDHVEGLPPSARREVLVSKIAQTLARESAESVTRWAESPDVDDARFKNTIFKKASGALAQYHLEEAKSWIISHYGEPYARDGAQLVALNWAHSDPDAAFAWLSSLPDGEEKREAVGFVFNYWLKSSPREASTWLEGADLGETLDAALRVKALSMASDDPVRAIEWARRIHDLGTRERTLVAIGQRWYRVDPDATRRWLAVSSLPRAGQKKILAAGRAKAEGTKR